MLNKIDERTKSHLIKVFRKGKTVSDIQENYPEFSRQQLAAIKAHVTMRTYGPNA